MYLVNAVALISFLTGISNFKPRKIRRLMEDVGDRSWTSW